MKIVCTFFLLAVALIANGQGANSNQDFCKQIVKDTSADKTIFDFFSPYDRFNPPPIRITRSYTTDKESPYDNFNIIFQQFSSDIENIYTINSAGEKVEKTELKLVVEFDDKTKIVDDSITINHDFSEDKTQAMRYAYFPVTDANIKDFTTKKIVKFSLAGFEQMAPADSLNSFQKYLKCIKSVK
jgi:hypothetical protein